MPAPQQERRVGSQLCEWAVRDLGGEGGDRTSGPNGLDLFLGAGRCCLLERDHSQPDGRYEQCRVGVTVTVGDADDRNSDRNPDPDPQPNGHPDPNPNPATQPASDGAGHGQGRPGDDRWLARARLRFVSTTAAS